MSNTYKWLLVIIVTILIIAGVWYYGSKPITPVATGPIKIGAVLSLTGAATATGDYSLKAIKLAEEEINKNGGINGRPVQVLVEDDQTNAKDATTAFSKLINVDKVDGVIGSLWDFTTQPLIPLALTSSTTLISPTNFRIAGSFDLNNQSFVMLSNLSEVVGKLKEYLNNNSIKKLGTVRFQSAFGAEIAKTLNQTMTDLGRGPIIDETYAQMGAGDFRTDILKLKQAKVDAVFLDMLDIDALSFIKQAKELNYQPKIITHTLILDALKNAKIDKKLLEGIVVVNWEIDSPQFAQLFKAKYNIDSAKSAEQSYQAVYVLAQAIAGAKDKGQVSQVLAEQPFTVLGKTLKFTKDHTIADVPVEIQVIKNGQLTKLY